MSHPIGHPEFQDNGEGRCWHCGGTAQEHLPASGSAERAIEIGARVVCVDDEASFNRLRAGNLYTVEANFDGSPCVMVNGAVHSISRFRPIEPQADPRTVFTAEKVGKVIDVRAGRDGEPMFRKLTSVLETRTHGALWFYWYWIPEQPTPEGHRDCGYSGEMVEGDAQ